VTYSARVITKLANLEHCRELPDSNAEGIGVNLACGSTVRFFLKIDGGGRIIDAAFRSNGCGYSRAAADVLADWVTNKQLVDLHGLNEAELNGVVGCELGEILPENFACVNAATSALKDAFANFRALSIDEFLGTEALICTCFSVTEQRIEDLIATSHLTSVEQVADLCNAGRGCGSCRLLIQEMLDSVL
jgi:NifU-like protein